jgi:flagellar hook assembly protein FlgD
MKTIFTTLLVAGLAIGAFANNENTPVEIRQTESSKVVVSVPSAIQGRVTVRIVDEDNRLVLRDRITSTEAFAKKYNLTELPEGTYSIEVSDANGTLKTATVSTVAKSTAPVYSRVSELGGNQYRLLVANLEAKDVQVQIFDGGQLIHSEAIDHPQGLHKIYTINKPGFSDAISFKVIVDQKLITYAAIR